MPVCVMMGVCVFIAAVPITKRVCVYYCSTYYKGTAVINTHSSIARRQPRRRGENRSIHMLRLTTIRNRRLTLIVIYHPLLPLLISLLIHIRLILLLIHLILPLIVAVRDDDVFFLFLQKRKIFASSSSSLSHSSSGSTELFLFTSNALFLGGRTGD